MRASMVAKAERSEAAKRKQTTGRTDDGLPVHSFQSLLADLATHARIRATTALNDKFVFTLHTRPTTIQQRAPSSFSPSTRIGSRGFAGNRSGRKQSGERRNNENLVQPGPAEPASVAIRGTSRREKVSLVRHACRSRCSTVAQHAEGP